MIGKIKWHINSWRKGRSRIALKKDFSDVLNTSNSYLNEFPVLDANKIIGDFSSIGIETEHLNIDYSSFLNWEKETYGKEFPNYYNEHHLKKCLEHYLSFVLLDLNGSEVLMDIASAISKMPDIAKKHYGLTKVYRQDLLNEPGVNGELIGSNAAEIPLASESVDVMTLHNSFEHFEEDSDVGFIKEANRVLRPGGRVCIIPLFLSNRHYIGTCKAEILREGRIPNFGVGTTIICDTISGEHEYPIYSRHYDYNALNKRLLSVLENRFSSRLIYFKDPKGMLTCPFCLMLTKV
jgi:SAM-dependent methyltransferase